MSTSELRSIDDDPFYDAARRFGQMLAAMALGSGIVSGNTSVGDYLLAEGFSGEEIQQNVDICGVILKELVQAGVVRLVVGGAG